MENENNTLTGIQKWCKQYNDLIDNESKIKETVEKRLLKYDRKKEEEVKINGDYNREGKVDEWTTVTSKKKRGKFATTRKETVIQNILSEEEKRKTKTQLLNFYSFQTKENNKEKLAKLRNEFEADKKKLDQIVAKRKFRPY